MVNEPPMFAGLSHLFLEMGPGPMELGKLAAFLLKLGNLTSACMYDASIARLILLIKML